MAEDPGKNVLGDSLQPCGLNPLTGFYREGCCRVGAEDYGIHAVCAEMTQEFLDFSLAKGNDLVTPRGTFPGLKAGDRWCLCAARWQEAFDAGVAPPVYLECTHEAALHVVEMEDLRAHARMH